MTEGGRLLVVGYGNDLRADDGAGRVVADRIEAMRLPGVAVRSVSQLTPELALEIAGQQCVIFVDADVTAEHVRMVRVSPAVRAGGIVTHHGEPAEIVMLASTVGPPPNEAWTISVPASNLDLGFSLSARTAQGVVDAIAAIVEYAQRYQRTAWESKATCGDLFGCDGRVG